MTNEDELMRTATFRFGVIADLVTASRFERGERERLIRQKIEREWLIPFSTRKRIARSTLLSWVTAYRKANKSLDGLKPKKRRDKGDYRALDSTLRMAIRELKKENPHYTLPVMLTKLKHARVLKHDDRVNASSIYRFIKNEKLDELAAEPVDRRRFEAQFPNEIWQCDVMHGPFVKTPTASRKAYLCAIIDDHSRLIVHAQFYLNETLSSLKDCLRHAIEKRGIPQKFYVDNGACYRAENLEQILALLGVGLAHSQPYKPQGRGKIERWFGTVRQSFIPLHADRGLSLEELNERLDCWVDEYNSKVHSTTGMSPYDRFKKHLSCIRPAPKDLLSYFRQVEHRFVKKDRTIHLNANIFEVAVMLIDKKVELRFFSDLPFEVEVFFEGRSFGMAVLLDARVNAKVGREGLNKRSVDANEKNITQPELTIPKSGKLFASEVSDE